MNNLLEKSFSRLLGYFEESSFPLTEKIWKGDEIGIEENILLNLEIKDMLLYHDSYYNAFYFLFSLKYPQGNFFTYIDSYEYYKYFYVPCFGQIRTNNIDNDIKLIRQKFVDIENCEKIVVGKFKTIFPLELVNEIKKYVCIKW